MGVHRRNRRGGRRKVNRGRRSGEEIDGSVRSGPTEVETQWAKWATEVMNGD